MLMGMLVSQRRGRVISVPSRVVYFSFKYGELHKTAIKEGLIR